MTSRRCQRDQPSSETVLILTDGSERAGRTTEWWLVFAKSREATVHRIDVLDCLDSGVIVQRYDGGQVERDGRERSPTSTLTGCAVSDHHIRAATIGVLHGVPHEAILDHISANSIDRIVLSVCGMTHPTRSFVGRTFVEVRHPVTVPVVIIRRPW